MFVKHANSTIAVLLGVVFLDTGLGHAFFNPTREAAIGILELIAAALLFAAAFLFYLRRSRVALVCYVISAGCLTITVVLHVVVLIQQLRAG